MSKLKKMEISKHLEQIKKYEITDRAEAIALGLTDKWTTFSMAEYGDEGYARFGKTIDVWIEYTFDISKDSQSENIERTTRWLELPPEQAEAWRDQRQKFWDKVKGHANKN
jgi:hypothetical protein